MKPEMARKEKKKENYFSYIASEVSETNYHKITISYE